MCAYSNLEYFNHTALINAQFQFYLILFSAGNEITRTRNMQEYFATQLAYYSVMA